MLRQPKCLLSKPAQKGDVASSNLWSLSVPLLLLGLILLAAVYFVQVKIK